MPRDRDDHPDPPERGERSPIRRSIDEATDRMFELIEEAARAAANIRAGAEDDERGDERRRPRRERDPDRDEEPDHDPDAERLAADRVNAISRLADSLVEYADQVRYESERLLRSLGERVRESDEPPRERRARRRKRDLDDRDRYLEYEDEENDYEEDDYEPPPRRRRSRRDRRRNSSVNSVPEEALLRATQMAVAGSSRGAIERFLVEEYGVDDPDPLLDSVLGADR